MLHIFLSFLSADMYALDLRILISRTYIFCRSIIVTKRTNYKTEILGLTIKILTMRTAFKHCFKKTILWESELKYFRL